MCVEKSGHSLKKYHCVGVEATIMIEVDSKYALPALRIDIGFSVVSDLKWTAIRINRKSKAQYNLVEELELIVVE